MCMCICMSACDINTPKRDSEQIYLSRMREKRNTMEVLETQTVIGSSVKIPKEKKVSFRMQSRMTTITVNVILGQCFISYQLLILVSLHMYNSFFFQQRFPTEDHLMIHRHKHEMTLKFPSIKNDNMLSGELCSFNTDYLTI